jgi:glutaminyl-tRNA synthetase
VSSPNKPTESPKPPPPISSATSSKPTSPPASMPSATGPASPGTAADHAAGAARPGEDPHPLSARTERLPALRPCQVHPAQLRPGQQYGGRCHLRFDDTNPEKEEQEYVDSIIDSPCKWLGCSGKTTKPIFIRPPTISTGWRPFAEYLISAGHAYVDSQSPTKCAPIAAR